MSNIELHNSYKCYDSIPTPPDGAKQYNDFRHQSANTFTSVGANNLARSASLDSLVNSSEQDSSDDLSDSDSLCELKNITPSDDGNVDRPRRSDIEECKNVEAPKEPVITAYLAKSHQSCDYENCGFKTDVNEKEKSDDDDENLNSSNAFAPPIIKSVRRNSVATSDSIRRMETILEEPIEPKISVKEILARFETMRETAEVKSVVVVGVEMIFKTIFMWWKLNN